MRWLPTLFAAEAIPSAMITFVALLMFLQLGVGWEWSTLLCSLLTLPWVMKSFVRAKLRQVGHFNWQLRFLELGMAFLLVALSFCFTDRFAAQWLIFACLFVLCLLCAAHELVARMYYERMLRPRWQRYYNSWKMFIAQSTVVLTYGVMVVGVGLLEVFYHNRRTAISLSWSMAVYILAGIYLLLVIYNLFVLRPPRVTDHTSSSLLSAVRAEIHVIDRIAHKPHWFGVVLCLAFLLLPQALLFHTRVLLFISSRTQGGLAVSLPWIGLIQGTVGVMAFSVGLAVGHWLLFRRPSSVLASSSRSLLSLMVLLLGLSPLVYWALASTLPSNLLVLCLAAFFAQLSFGFGLNATMPFVRYISGERYRNTINYLYIPLISFVMLLPMAASGWLVSVFGFLHFFLLNAFTVLLAYVAAYVGLRLVSSSSQTIHSPHNEK